MDEYSTIEDLDFIRNGFPRGYAAEAPEVIFVLFPKPLQTNPRLSLGYHWNIVQAQNFAL